MTTETNVKPAPQLEKMPNLDGLRAFACMFVVISHIPKASFAGLIGAVGVGVFFTLSGFLMGHLYARQPCSSASVHQYAIARVARIVPIYWLVISVCILLSMVEDGDFPLRIDTLGSIVRHYGLGGNVGPFWSIPLEIQYYLFFVFIWYCLSLRQKTSLPLLFAGLVCIVLVATNDHWPNLSLPNKLHFFLAGTIAGIAPRAFWQTANRTTLLITLQLLALVVILIPLTLDYDSERFYDSLGLSIAFAVAIYLLSFPTRVSAALLASRAIRKIGQASFSIYLIHVLVLYYGARLLQLDHHHFHPLWLVLAAIATALPILVSHYIEMPLQRVSRDCLRRLFTRQHPASLAQTG